jgi:hypothetical protein
VTTACFIPASEAWEHPMHGHDQCIKPVPTEGSEIMRRIKGRTSSKLLEEFPHLKSDIGGGIFGQGDIFVQHRPKLPMK